VTENDAVDVGLKLMIVAALVLLFRMMWNDLPMHGARPITYVVAGILVGIGLVPQLLPNATPLIRFGAAAGALLAMTSPRLLVKVTGGPRLEMLLLRESWSIIRDVNRLRPAIAEPVASQLKARTIGLNQYRKPLTARYIDAFQHVILADPELDGSDLRHGIDEIQAAELELARRSRITLVPRRRTHEGGGNQ
jgi:hypothetical protein